MADDNAATSGDWRNEVGFSKRLENILKMHVALVVN
jgi:hypothetical protein